MLNTCCACVSCSVMFNSLRAPRTLACQAPLSREFSRQEYWGGSPFPSPGDLPDPGVEPRSSALQADSWLSEPPGNPKLKVTITVCMSAKSLFSALCNPIDCSPPGSSFHGPLDKNIGRGCHALLQGIFPTQGSNSCLLWLLQGQAGSLPLAPSGKDLGVTRHLSHVEG